MDVIKALHERKSVRAFLPTPVNKADITQILNSAKYAPSGTNTQPWQVAVVTGNAKLALDKKLTNAFRDNLPRNPDYNYYPAEFNSDFKRRRIECGLALYQTLGIDKSDKQGRLAQWEKNYSAFGAPVALYIFTDKLVDKGSFLDCGMFIQSILLMATSLGLATCAQAALAEYPDIVRTHLGYSKEQLLICGIALGYEDKSAVINNYRTSREPLEYFTKFFDEDSFIP